jgi:hypothetical protein
MFETGLLYEASCAIAEAVGKVRGYEYYFRHHHTISSLHAGPIACAGTRHVEFMECVDMF